MPTNNLHAMHAERALDEVAEALDYLRHAVDLLEQCQDDSNGRNWHSFARNADSAFVSTQGATLHLGRAGTYALKRASFK